MAAGGVHPEKAEGQPRPVPVHSSDTTTATSNPRPDQGPDFTRDQAEIEVVDETNAAQSTTDKTRHEATCPDDDVPASRVQSRAAASTRSRALSIVPRSKRRGLFGRFAIVAEVSTPYDYPNSTKWGITATISLATAAGPMGSSIFYRTQCPLPL